MPFLSHRGHCPSGASAPSRASWPSTLPGRDQAQGYRDMAFSLQASGSQSQAKGQLPPAVPQLAPPADGLFWNSGQASRSRAFGSVGSVLCSWGYDPSGLLGRAAKPQPLVRLIPEASSGCLPRPRPGRTFWLRNPLRVRAAGARAPGACCCPVSEQSMPGWRRVLPVCGTGMPRGLSGEGGRQPEEQPLGSKLVRHWPRQHT